MIIKFLLLSAAIFRTKATDCGSIIDILDRDHRFDTLVQLLKAGNLEEILNSMDTNFTILAPTDRAFSHLPSNKLRNLLKLKNRHKLKNLLLYHILPDRKITEYLFEEGLSETASDQLLEIKFVKRDVVFNDMAEVVDFEVGGDRICNGAIHAIDRVIAPLPTIFDFIYRDNRFDTLVTALQKTNLKNFFDEGQRITLFAPTDLAFNNINESELHKLLTENLDVLKNILLYHMVPGVLSREHLSDGIVKNLENENIRVDNNGQEIEINNSANVVRFDYATSNGIVHVIDKVLFPPKNIVDIADDNNELDTFVTLLHSTELFEMIRDGEFTIFAPSNRAFSNLEGSVMQQILSSPKILTNILLYHTIEGTKLRQDITEGGLETIEGKDVHIDFRSNRFYVNDHEIKDVDILASNGILYTIDEVLIPPSLNLNDGKNDGSGINDDEDDDDGVNLGNKKSNDKDDENQYCTCSKCNQVSEVCSEDCICLCKDGFKRIGDDCYFNLSGIGSLSQLTRQPSVQQQQQQTELPTVISTKQQIVPSTIMPVNPLIDQTTVSPTDNKNENDSGEGHFSDKDGANKDCTCSKCNKISETCNRDCICVCKDGFKRIGDDCFFDLSGKGSLSQLTRQPSVQQQQQTEPPIAILTERPIASQTILPTKQEIVPSTILPVNPPVNQTTSSQTKQPIDPPKMSSTKQPTNLATKSPTEQVIDLTLSPTKQPIYPEAAPPMVSISNCPVIPDIGCSICGQGKCVGNLDAIFAFPNQPAVSCNLLQQAGLAGAIPSTQCAFLPNLIVACECRGEDL